MICVGKVSQGIFRPHDPAAGVTASGPAVCLLEGKEVTLSIEKVKLRRSNRENKYYHGVVLKILSMATGYTVEEMHDLCRQMFLGERVYFGNSSAVKTPSTSRLDTASFEAYLESIRRWASMELGVYIPNPNEPPMEVYQ